MESKSKGKPGVPKRKPHDDLFDPTKPKIGRPKKHTIADDVPDLFGAPMDVLTPDEVKKIEPERLGGIDKWVHDTNLLKIEWAIKYPNMAPSTFLKEIKGYAAAQAKDITDKSGGNTAWHRERHVILDKMTESTVKRHIDQIAEVQETHVKASKIGLAKAIEMLTKMSIDPARDKEGKLIMDGKGKPVYRGFRSSDLLNTLSAIEKAQQIYRRAMGLPNDSDGLAQIMEKVDQINVQNNHLHIHEAPTGAPTDSSVVELEKKLEYDEIMELIEYRREKKKELEEESEKNDG